MTHVVGVEEGGPAVAHPDRGQVQHLLAEAVEDAAEARVGVLVDDDVAEVVADGDGGRPRVAHVLDASQRVRKVLQCRQLCQRWVSGLCPV